MSSTKRRKMAPPAEAPEANETHETHDDSATLDEGSTVESTPKTFKDLGIVDPLVEACHSLGYKHPTPIQAQSIPLALQNRDLIGLAETGSGKTAAFTLPILQALLEKPSAFFGLILAPTRELATQIGQAVDALGASISVRCAVIVGGLDMVPQAIALSKKPHIVVATPGRLLDHLEKTKGFKLSNTKYLVIDEADRLLDMDFGPILDKLLKFLPRERRTFLFSATMSSKVESLQRASLRDPLRVSITTNKYQTVSTLKQYYVFIPHMHKDSYLIFLVASEFTVATDVAARGLDIPKVDVVLNYDLPQDSKTYVHRVGRTARAGNAGQAISLVTQYDIEIYQRIEAALGKKLDEYETDKEEVMVFKSRVEEAQRHARTEMKNLMEDRGNKGSVLKGRHAGRTAKRRHDAMDAEEG
ncbi:hypothetical protein ABKA04_009857 [Annulohypoxylon sp. FPYF3050]